MAIQSERNLYPGINPHLNSFLQQPDGAWEAFHAHHTVELARLLDATLPEAYYALAEKSLQISSYLGENELPVRSSRTTPDATIYRDAPANVPQSRSSAMTPTMTFPITETFVEEDTLTSVMIYRLDQGKVPGTPVTRIELLSPGNKRGGSHHLSYLAKRQETLQSSINLVEIDYLHQKPPILARIPSYPDRTPNSYPYLIIISDIRPKVIEGKTQVYGINVDAPLPILQIPLASSDMLIFDFQGAYDATYQMTKAFRKLVDYEQEPVNFDRYHPRDQAYIRSRMQEIAAEFATS